jgi:hypothetical protein
VSDPHNGHRRCDALERRQREQDAAIAKLREDMIKEIESLTRTFEQALQSRNRVIQDHERRLKRLEDGGT